MNGVTFLTVGDVKVIHDEPLKAWGGLDGVRDEGLLASALAQPQMSFGGQYVHETIWDMASAYLYHIVRNHPFLDGNKRTGFVSALVFLELNGIVMPSEEEVGCYGVVMVLDVANGLASKKNVATLFRGLGER